MTIGGFWAWVTYLKKIRNIKCYMVVGIFVKEVEKGLRNHGHINTEN